MEEYWLERNKVTNKYPKGREYECCNLVGVNPTDKTGLTGWEFSSTAAYTMEAYLNGKKATLGQRERPQVVLLNGSITHLFNGARGPKGFHGGNTFNMVTEICQHGPAVGGVCPSARE